MGDYLFASISPVHTFSWQTIRMAWLLTLPFILLFVVNNYFLAPRLLLRKRYWAYALSLAGVVTLLFILYPSINPPQHKQFQNLMPMQPRRYPEGKVLPDREREFPNTFPEHSSPLLLPKQELDMRWRGPHPLPGYFLGRLSLALLVVGINVAIKLLFKSMRDEEALKELEHQHLQSELQYLKYQINPHFFMNTPVSYTHLTLPTILRV